MLSLLSVLSFQTITQSGSSSGKHTLKWSTYRTHREAIERMTSIFNTFLSIKKVSLLLYIICAGVCSHDSYISALGFLPSENNNRKLLQTENCLCKIIHQSEHGDLIWFSQSFLFCCDFIALELSVFISVLTSHYVLLTVNLLTHTGRNALPENNPFKRITYSTWYDTEKTKCKQRKRWLSSFNDPSVVFCYLFRPPTSPLCWVTDNRLL